MSCKNCGFGTGVPLHIVVSSEVNTAKVLKSRCLSYKIYV